MGEAIGGVLSFGVAVALSPLPIVAVVLMLVTPRARTNGPAFIVGWIVGLALVGVIVIAVVSPSSATEAGEPETWVSVLKLVLGLLLLALAVAEWRKRPKEGAEVETPKWMQTVDTFSPVKALLAGAVLSGANPKNLLLAVGAATEVAQSDISGAEQAVAYGVFVLLGTIGVAAPVAIYFFMGDRARPILDRLESSMSANNATIMAVLLLVIGMKQVGAGIAGL